MRAFFFLVLFVADCNADRLLPRLDWQFVGEHCRRRSDGTTYCVPAHWHEKGKHCPTCAGTDGLTAQPPQPSGATADQIREIIEDWDADVTSTLRHQVDQLRQEAARERSDLERRLLDELAAVPPLIPIPNEPAEPTPPDVNWLAIGLTAASGALGIGLPWWAVTALRGLSRGRRRRQNEQVAGWEAPAAQPFCDPHGN